MIEIKTIASGSTGNCYHISDGHAGLLIECGIRYKKIQEALEFKVSHVAGCLVSHEHGDHSLSVDKLTKYGVDCYMSPGTADALGLKSHRLKLISHKKKTRVGAFLVWAFATQHDAEEPLGFLIQGPSGDRLLYASDTFYIRFRFSRISHFMVECNYQRDILGHNVQHGITAQAVKTRLLESHFELEDVKEFFRAADLSRCREIHLIHMSKTNCDPAHCRAEIQKITGKPVYVGGEA